MLLLWSLSLTSQPVSWDYIVSSSSTWPTVKEVFSSEPLLTEVPKTSPDSTKVLWTLHRHLSESDRTLVLQLDSTAIFIHSSEIEDWLKSNSWEER